MNKRRPHHPIPFLASSFSLALLLLSTRWQCRKPKSATPPLNAVVGAALRHARLDLTEPSSWRSRLHWSALLPRLSAKVGQRLGNGLYVDLRPGSADSLDQSQNSSLRWQVGAKWDLGLLLFDSRELKISAAERRLIRARETLVEQVVDLYHERLHLQQALELADQLEEEKLAKRIRLAHVTARLDLLTAGRFATLPRRSPRTTTGLRGGLAAGPSGAKTRTAFSPANTKY